MVWKLGMVIHSNECPYRLRTEKVKDNYHINNCRLNSLECIKINCPLALDYPPNASPSEPKGKGSQQSKADKYPCKRLLCISNIDGTCNVWDKQKIYDRCKERRSEMLTVRARLGTAEGGGVTENKEGCQ